MIIKKQKQNVLVVVRLSRLLQPSLKHNKLLERWILGTARARSNKMITQVCDVVKSPSRLPPEEKKNGRKNTHTPKKYNLKKDEEETKIGRKIPQKFQNLASGQNGFSSIQFHWKHWHQNSDVVEVYAVPEQILALKIVHSIAEGLFDTPKFLPQKYKQNKTKQTGRPVSKFVHSKLQHWFGLDWIQRRTPRSPLETQRN